MPLAMSRPWKHPDSGVYWLRKGVPDDLRALVGKREEKRSLGTRDPVEAKRRHAEALAEIEERWANLRLGPKILTEKEAHQLAMFVLMPNGTLPFLPRRGPWALAPHCGSVRPRCRSAG